MQVLGMATNKFLPNVVKAVLPITPVIGVVSTCLLVASAVAQCAPGKIPRTKSMDHSYCSCCTFNMMCMNKLRGVTVSCDM